MSDGNTRENFEGASIPEPIEIVNNTIAENQFGITGGASVIAVNNILMLNARTAMKNVDGQSEISHNLFWKNRTDEQGSNQSLKSIAFKPSLESRLSSPK